MAEACARVWRDSEHLTAFDRASECCRPWEGSARAQNLGRKSLAEPVANVAIQHDIASENSIATAKSRDIDFADVVRRFMNSAG